MKEISQICSLPHIDSSRFDNGDTTASAHTLNLQVHETCLFAYMTRRTLLTYRHMAFQFRHCVTAWVVALRTSYNWKQLTTANNRQI
jgi:hypothetical protein